MEKAIIEVCAAVILQGDRLLLATRRPGGHLAGKWEFPGGKIASGETPARCIARELEEELHLKLLASTELFRMEHAYPEKKVGLHFMLCRVADGLVASPAEGQKCGWFSAAEAAALDLAPADERAISLMRDAAEGKPHDEVADLDIAKAKPLLDFWLTAQNVSMGHLPPWLHTSFGGVRNHLLMKGLIRSGGLHTVCESANCPNRSECWKHKTATFMILGGICTRFCRFCAVDHGIPAPPDPNEPEKVAESVASLGLGYAVITCVTRDDLPDGGSAAMAATVTAIQKRVPGAKVEVLCSDYGGNMDCVDTVLKAGPTVFGHNVETVERLTPAIRNKADYRRSLAVLAYAASKTSVYGVAVKSGLMLGLGERPEEIRQTMADLRDAGVQIITLGQYLRPTHKHWPVARYIPPQEFDGWKRIAENEFGFVRAVSGPFVRSSFMAEEAFASTGLH
ncbi:MAG: lipoyl synthase [Victivallales bacterium]|nr:lipoyl synthase [Victivallales bacterium]